MTICCDFKAKDSISKEPMAVILEKGGHIEILRVPLYEYIFSWRVTLIEYVYQIWSLYPNLKVFLKKLCNHLLYYTWNW